MEIIKNNPYRTIGVLAGASERDIQRQRTKINAYLAVGKDFSFDTDFPFIGNIERDSETVSTAFSQIEQSKNRINHSLFWFVQGSHYDEAAIAHLKDNNVQKAVEIWEKVTQAGVVTGRSYSAFNNLGTLKLGLALKAQTVDKTLLKQGLQHKMQLLGSENFQDFVAKVADESFKVNPTEQSKEFIDRVLELLSPYVGKPNGIVAGELSGLFAGSNPDSLDYLFTKVSEKPLHEIESKIERTKKARSNQPAGANKLGSSLYYDTQEHLTIIKGVLGASNLQYQKVADRLSREILQCGVDFFGHYRDHDSFDPGDETIKLFRLAKLVAVGPQALEQATENIKGVQEWIDGRPERDKEKKVKPDFEKVMDILDEYESKDQNSASATALLRACKPYVNNIKSALGPYDEFYLKVSTRVVLDAQDMIIKEINITQEFVAKKISEALSYEMKRAYFDIMKTKLKEAWTATQLLGSYDMTISYRTKFSENKQALSNLCTQFGVTTSGSSSASTSRPASSSSSSTTTSSSSTTRTSSSTYNEKSWAEENPGCLAMIICIVLGGIIGAASGGEEGMIGGAVMGFLLGGLISRAFD